MLTGYFYLNIFDILHTVFIRMKKEGFFFKYFIQIVLAGDVDNDFSPLHVYLKYS